MLFKFSVVLVLLDSLQDHLGLGAPHSYLQEVILSAQ